MKEYIMIVGGAGYIGSQVSKELFKKGYNIIVYDNLIYGHRDFVKWGEFIYGDIGDRNKLEEVFSSYKIKAVMHFAAFTYVGESVQKPFIYYWNNVANTSVLLDSMIKNNIKIFIFSSTCATYGIPNQIPIPESHSQNPINPYGKSKLMVEQILKDFDKAYGLKYCSLRYFNAAGADPDGDVGEDHNPETHLIPLVLYAAGEKREYIEIYGTDYDTPDGTCIRDFIHTVDLASAHILALEYLLDGGNSAFYNLGNGEGYSVREVIEAACKITGKNIKVKEGKRREGDPPRLVGSSEKIKQELSWKSLYPDIKDILATAWKWHQKRHGLQ